MKEPIELPSPADASGVDGLGRHGFLGMVDVRCVVGKDRRELLKRASFRVDRGKVVAMLGPSGSGKTSLLRALAGLLPLEYGEVALRGAYVGRMAPEDRHIAMLFQHPPIISDTNLIRNAVLGNGPEWRDPKLEAYARHVAESLELSDHLQKPMTQLSGGELQRAALVRVLCSPHDIVLLDEPIKNSLSAGMKSRATSVIRENLVSHGRTAIVVTHDIDEASVLADEILVIDGKELVQGRLAALFHDPPSRNVAEALGSLLDLPIRSRDISAGVFAALPIHFEGSPIPSTRVRRADKAAVRPTDVRIVAGMEFRVREVRNSVERTFLSVETAAGDVTLQQIPCPLDTRIGVGDLVGLRIPYSRIIFFNEYGKTIRD